MNFKEEPLSNGNIVTKKKLELFGRNMVTALFLIGVIAFLIRLYYFHPDLPFAEDANIYFFYAFDTSILGHLPENYSPINNGWPAFLSIFFSIFHFDDALSYMAVQRLLTIIISVITIIPVYLLCKKFFEKKYSIVGAAIIAFEPRIILSSLLGTADTLYIFLVATTLVLFFGSKKMIYSSFGIAALAALVRPEGLLLFLAISIMFFVKFRKDRLAIPRYIPAVLIFVLILLPMVQYRIEATGQDGLIGRAVDTISFHFLTPEEGSDEWEKLLPRQQEELKRDGISGVPFILTGIENYPKFLGWIFIPIFIFFVPIGAILIFKNLNFRKLTVIVSIISMSIPAFYAYSIPLPDTRYLYFLYPLFCVLSIFTVKKFVNKFKNQHLILILIVGGILTTSVIFLDYKKIDYEHEIEALEIAKQIIAEPKGINTGLNYIKSAQILENWSNLKLDDETGYPLLEITRIYTTDFDSLQNFIETSKDNGLTHLALDGKQKSNFLNDVFYHDEKYHYLIKEYDSLEHGFDYHVKVYRIDYDLLGN